MMKCQCNVCLALSGLQVHDATPSVLRQLPPEVQTILAAQGRVRFRRRRLGDEEIVRQAAQKCRAGRFHLPPETH